MQAANDSARHSQFQEKEKTTTELNIFISKNFFDGK